MADPATTIEIARPFLDYGVLGALVVVAGLTIRHLVKRNYELQDKLIEAKVETVTAHRDALTVVQENTRAIEASAKAIEAVGDLVKARGGP